MVRCKTRSSRRGAPAINWQGNDILKLQGAGFYCGSFAFSGLVVWSRPSGGGLEVLPEWETPSTNSNAPIKGNHRLLFHCLNITNPNQETHPTKTPERRCWKNLGLSFSLKGSRKMAASLFFWGGVPSKTDTPQDFGEAHGGHELEAAQSDDPQRGLVWPTPRRRVGMRDAAGMGNSCTRPPFQGLIPPFSGP